MDFYWHYSSKEVIDEGGKEYFLRAIQVCSQVFNTLTESIQVNFFFNLILSIKNQLFFRDHALATK